MRNSLFGLIVVGIGRWGGISLVACREPYPPERGTGDAPLRLLPLEYLQEGWQFPHSLKADLRYDWDKEELQLELQVKNGGPTDASAIEAQFNNERRSFAFLRSAVGSYRYRVPRSDLRHDLPSYTVRLRREYFSNDGGEWLTLHHVIR